MEIGDNPHRRGAVQDAEMEYIPLLPLAWTANKNPQCSFKLIIEDILKVQSYLIKRDGQMQASEYMGSDWLTLPPKFTVTSAYNLRTQLGTGMPTQVRRGESWHAVMNFVMQLTVGHYERYPQCPDLLRKSWKSIVELPYISLGTDESVIHSKPPDLPNHGTNSVNRKFMFFFSGNFELFGPELVCSVRNAVANLNSRPDVLVVNITRTQSMDVPQRILSTYMSQSVFCLIAKGDSYSSSFFYHALESGCIPVVISEWFTFAFPWAVPYEKFVIRVAEGDFLKNADFVLDYIKSTIGNNPDLIFDMRENIQKYRGLLSFERVEFHSDYYRTLMSNDMYFGTLLAAKGREGFGEHAVDAASEKFARFGAYIPFELMLLEIRYSQHPHKYYNNIPCTRPYMCHNDRTVQSNFNPNKTDYTFYTAAAKKQSLVRMYKKSRAGGSGMISKTAAVRAGSSGSISSSSDNNGGTSTSSSSSSFPSHGYDLVDAGYQVNPLKLPPSPDFFDTRSHLCRHNGRLIGGYKIVFFMQCVRILWPLSPGQFKPVDNADRFETAGSGEAAAAMPQRKGQKGGSKFIVDPAGISEFDRRYVQYFHNISARPAGWWPYAYPLTNNTRHVYRVQDLIDDLVK